MQRFGMSCAGRGASVIALMQRSSLVVSTTLIVVTSLFSTACREDAEASPIASALASPPASLRASLPAPPPSTPTTHPASQLASAPTSLPASAPASALRSAPVTAPAVPPTPSLPSSPALSREAVDSSLNMLLDSERIDAATRARAIGPADAGRARHVGWTGCRRHY